MIVFSVNGHTEGFIVRGRGRWSINFKTVNDAAVDGIPVDSLSGSHLEFTALNVTYPMHTFKTLAKNAAVFKATFMGESKRRLKPHESSFS